MEISWPVRCFLTATSDSGTSPGCHDPTSVSRPDISPNTVAFTLINAFRRSGYDGSGGDGFPIVGDTFLEDIGDTELFFGDGDVTFVLDYEVLAFDVAGNWVLGRAFITAVSPGTGVTVAETEANDTAASADSMALRDDYTGAIDSAGDTDFVSFFATGGTVIDARTVLGTLDDSILSLFDTDGTTLLDINDDCVDFESCIESFTIPVDGTYFLMVEAFSSVGTGTYTLELRESAPPAAEIIHTYPGPGPFTARIDSCCRTGAEENNPGDGYQVEAIVDLAGGNTGNPVSSLPAIVDCPFPAVCNFNIPAVDVDGDPLTFRFSTPTESGDSTFNQPGLPPNPVAPNPASIGSTGLYSWDTTGAPGGVGALYSTQVTIEEQDGQGGVIGKSALDFLIRLATGTPPVFDVPPTPAVGTNFPVSPGGNVNFTVQASDPDIQDDVAVSHLGLPTGATLTCGAAGNPTTCTFDWTPGVGDLGVHVINFTAQDQGGLNAAPHGITITVLQEQVPPTCTPSSNPPQFTVQDVGSGLDSVNVTSEINATVNVPAFTAGTTDPVVVTVTHVDPTQSATVDLEVVDRAGNTTTCQLVLAATVTHDFGDAPAPYPTLIADNGAGHTIDPTLFLGASVDPDPDGQPSGLAIGDDTDGNDDEDGVVFTTLLVTCESSGVDVTASKSGHLDAWVDFDGNGSWADAGEQIFTSQPLSGGVNNLTFSVPCTATPTNLTFARFRFSTAGGLSFDGIARDGEVEDYAPEINGLDFGDAPAPYPTLLVDNGARHVLSTGPFLGATVDAEPDGQPDPNALGDDNSGIDDEDGVIFLTTLEVGTSADVEVTATASGLLYAWVDFNDNGSWADAGEQVFAGQALTTGAKVLSFAVPGTASANVTTFARFRFSSSAVAFDGLAADGEVEDYEVEVVGNKPPVADANGPYVANEGDTIVLDGSGSSDPDGDSLSFEWQFDGASFFNVVASITKDDDFAGTATLIVDDGNGGTDSDTASVTFLNVAPSVSAGADQTVNDGDTVTLDPATFTDPGILDTHTATIDWGDGTVESGAVSEASGSGTVSGSHVYSIDGGIQYGGTQFFTVTVTVTDDDGGNGSDTLVVEVVSAAP